jgi:hypothetical protein
MVFGKGGPPNHGQEYPYTLLFFFNKYHSGLIGGKDDHQEFWRRGSMPASSLVDSETAKKYL